jgi:signal transduction histidine kinase
MKENEEKGEMLICTYKKRNEVILSVKDEGPGISPEILNKIGTPFFTTKENGTGLGLAVCFGIAEAHNARIEIKNSKTGAVFKVIFMKNIT